MSGTAGVVALVLLLAGLPIPFVIGLAALAGLQAGGLPLALAVQRMFAAQDSFQLMAIPLFILAGALMNAGGLSERLVALAEALVGRLRGGLNHVNILSNVFFSGISGSAAADASAVGSILIPAMERAGYRRELAAAVTAAASLIGPIVPPSIPMILYGVQAEVSIARLFLAGAVPGLLLAAAQMATAAWVARREGLVAGRKGNLSEILRALRGAIWAAFMPVLILGGILGGVFTPTEAAAAAVAWALLVGAFVHRELTLARIGQALAEAALTTGIVMLMLATTEILAWILARDQIPQRLAMAVAGMDVPPWVVLLLVNVALLLVGIPLEPAPALVLLVPVLMPLVQRIGVDPVHFGVIMVLNLVIGLVTPPVGASIFVVSAISRVPLGSMAKAMVPFLVASLVVLLLVTYVPALSLWLPSLARGG
ncbi:TRAP transporter large permease [Carboxydochorda subterranea]|uniref:TRAP transporter large permease n=1 Tax=Carboxydichorda subterranea TaxID=3109565 RepID=A0ABZ1BVG8_9FIRM|nr:TRAP transporter large permease [Limnochorda sp. L945t]WRP16153.1 TRAP transporter large permease [Limnochorda sp. L945t]